MNIDKFRLPLIVAGCVLAAACHIDRIPPRSMTAGAMHMCKRRVLRFARTHKKLPASLHDIPEIPGYDNGITDGWGRELDYEARPDGTVSLRTLGSDRAPGG